MLAPEHCSMCCYYITGVISFSPLFSLFVTNITSTTIAATAKLSLSSRRQTSENFQRVSKANDFPKLISTVSRKLFNPPGFGQYIRCLNDVWWRRSTRMTHVGVMSKYWLFVSHVSSVQRNICWKVLVTTLFGDDKHQHAISNYIIILFCLGLE